ncbi:hypothetical protein DXG01_007868 [Tephrocybe rancida]|nr:hypothetical protein DXG01_007868 [Tephrocybe rancida]
MSLKPFYLFLTLISLALGILGAALQPSQRVPEKRDDNFPARVPYVFPPPGTDPIADDIRARRVNGTLLALDGALIQHEPVGRSEGLTTEQLRAIRLTPSMKESAEASRALGPSLSAMMLFTDWSTSTAQVPDRVFAGLQKFLNNQQLVEATATVGGYNFVSRFLLALDVDGKNSVPVPIPN